MGPKHISRWQLRLLMAGLFMLVGFGAVIGPAAAQDDGDDSVVIADDATPVDPGDSSGDDNGVSALPETGTGTTDSGSGWDIGTVSIAALVTMTLGVAVFGGRAMMRQRS